MFGFPWNPWRSVQPGDAAHSDPLLALPCIMGPSREAGVMLRQGEDTVVYIPVYLGWM